MASAEAQNRFGGREERRVSRAARHELHLRVGLAAVGFEGHGPVTARIVVVRAGDGRAPRREQQQRHGHPRERLAPHPDIGRATGDRADLCFHPCLPSSPG